MMVEIEVCAMIPVYGKLVVEVEEATDGCVKDAVEVRRDEISWEILDGDEVVQRASYETDSHQIVEVKPAEL